MMASGISLAIGGRRNWQTVLNGLRHQYIYQHTCFSLLLYPFFYLFFLFFNFPTPLPRYSSSAISDIALDTVISISVIATDISITMSKHSCWGEMLPRTYTMQFAHQAH